MLGTLQLPGNQGSALWQGAAWDPETNMLYVPSVSNMTVQALQTGGTRSDMTYIGGAGGGGEAPQGGRAAGPGGGAGRRTCRWSRSAGRPDERRTCGPGRTAGRAAQRLAQQVVAEAARRRTWSGAAAAPGGRSIRRPNSAAERWLHSARSSRGPWGLGPQGLPLIKPPYGRITAYNMNAGDIAWQVANGDTYDWIKNHPALKGITIPKTGRADEGGIVVTKTLLFAGQGCGLFRSGQGGSEMFYAYDKATGAVVHEMALPGGTCGNPMTYAINGKQYIAVSVGSRTTTAEIDGSWRFLRVGHTEGQRPEGMIASTTMREFRARSNCRRRLDAKSAHRFCLVPGRCGGDHRPDLLLSAGRGVGAQEPG